MRSSMRIADNVTKDVPSWLPRVMIRTRTRFCMKVMPYDWSWGRRVKVNKGQFGDSYTILKLARANGGGNPILTTIRTP